MGARDKVIPHKWRPRGRWNRIANRTCACGQEDWPKRAGEFFQLQELAVLGRDRMIGLTSRPNRHYSRTELVAARLTVC